MSVLHLPPCNPTKIICVHVNDISRYYEFKDTRTPPASSDSDGVRRVALGNEERLPDKFKAS